MERDEVYENAVTRGDLPIYDYNSEKACNIGWDAATEKAYEIFKELLDDYFSENGWTEKYIITLEQLKNQMS